MNIPNLLHTAFGSLAALGQRRLLTLGAAGLLVFVGTGLAGYLLSRPSFELLYAGLDRQDVTRMGAALRDANIAFDISADGTNVLVAAGQTSHARMLLAEKGLPHSSNVGYELFDKLGSLGLTSFMQDMTRVRALEGELARTIGTMNGVRAVRVHLVVSDEGSFRHARQPPSASVVLRTEGRADPAMARAIRHLVSSAVAGLSIGAVTVLTTDGETLAAGDESDSTASSGMLTLERTLANTLGDNIRRTLAPYLGVGNVQVSVAARLNTDRRQTNETVFNPDSRVERSVRTIKETQVAQNSAAQAATSVDRNLPSDGKRAGGDGKQSNEENQKREEITNYEVSSKTVATVSVGYAVDHLDVAILVNSAGLGDIKAEDVERKLADIRDLAMAAAGLRKERGDTIKVSAVAFKGADVEAEPAFMASAAPVLLRQAGPLFNVLAAIAILAVVLFGARSLLRQIKTPTPLATLPADAAVGGSTAAIPPAPAPPPAIEFAGESPRRALQRRLEHLAEADDEATAALFKRWIRGSEPA